MAEQQKPAQQSNGSKHSVWHSGSELLLLQEHLCQAQCHVLFLNKNVEYMVNMETTSSIQETNITKVMFVS